MATRGRPKKNGKAPMWMLQRITVALCGYEQARNRGEKHDTAVEEAEKYVRRKLPGVPISKTEVRRILASCRPETDESALSVLEVDPKNNTYTLPDGKTVRMLWTASYGPRIEYPRVNAATLKLDSSKS